MEVGRDLGWDGCINVRDLGGLPTRGGGLTRRHQVIRADNPSLLTPVGWEAAVAHGVRTVVALRTVGVADDEIDQDAIPAGVSVRRVEVEDATDVLFVERCVTTGWWESPLQFAEMLQHWPRRCAAAVHAVATAPPGGVVVSCGRGADRTGLVAFLILALVEVDAGTIADDWAMSLDRLAPRYPEQRDVVTRLFREQKTTVHETIDSTLERFDIADVLQGAGLPADDIEALRRRLLA